MVFQKTGYGKKELLSNVALGVSDGVDSALWCYAFATIIFTNALVVFLPIGLAIILGGWALLSIFIALTSKVHVHMISIDEQAVVIIGSVAVLMISSLGDEAVSSRGLSTILAVMSLISLSVSLIFYIANRYQISRLLELLPYPVICGFMAGVGWLLLDAGVVVALDTSISIDLLSTLQLGNNFYKLMICILGGISLIVFTSRIEKAWALPVATVFIIIMFYGIASLNGYEISRLRSEGWMFDIPTPEGGISELLSSVAFAQVDTDFIISVIPQMVTAIFLTMLSASMNLSALSVINVKANMDTSEEMQGMGAGNLVCGLIGCPPGYTDAPASILYDGFGASTRWMPLASSLVCLIVAVSGNWLISYTPKVLIGATILLFAFQLFYDWMYENVRNFSKLDYAIVCIILVTVIFQGFMQGILIGIILTVLVFLLHYSTVPAIQGQFALKDHRSSVERSTSSNTLIENYGSEALVFKLRGYLFFGTANTIRDTIRDNISKGSYSSILLNLDHVTGLDTSTMNAFSNIRQICEAHDVQLFYSCREKDIVEKLIKFDVVSSIDGRPQIFRDVDLALEYMEDNLITKYTDEQSKNSIHQHLMNLLQSEKKVKFLLDNMVRADYRKGEFLFHQGDPNTGIYILSSGSVSAMIHSGKGCGQRVKKYSPGSVIGARSRYTTDKTRTASVIANTSSVLYYMNLENLAKLEDMSVIHELVARSQCIRIDYLNHRLMRELN